MKPARELFLERAAELRKRAEHPPTSTAGAFMRRRAVSLESLASLSGLLVVDEGAEVLLHGISCFDAGALERVVAFIRLRDSHRESGCHRVLDELGVPRDENGVRLTVYGRLQELLTATEAAPAASAIGMQQ